MRFRTLNSRLALGLLLGALLLPGCGGGGGYHAVSGVASSSLTNVLLRLGFDGLAGLSRPRADAAALPHVANGAQSATITVTGAGGQVNVYTVNRANGGKYLQAANSPFQVTPGPVSLDVIFYDLPGGAGANVAEYKNLGAVLNADGTLAFTDQSASRQTISVVAAPNTLPAAPQLFLVGNPTLPQGTTQTLPVEAAIPAGAPDSVFGTAQLALSGSTQATGTLNNPTADSQYLGVSTAGPNAVTLAAQAPASSSQTLTQPRGIMVTFTLTDSVTGNTFGSLSATVSVTPQVPVITGLRPPTGAVNTTVAISGTSLSGATAVKFNGVSAAFTPDPSLPATLISATVPAGATTGPVTVTTPGGTATSPSAFTVTP